MPKQAAKLPIQVLMLGWEYPPSINGGLGIASSELAQALSRRIPLRLLIPTRVPTEDPVSLAQEARPLLVSGSDKTASSPRSHLNPYADASKPGVYGKDIIQQTSRFSQKILEQAKGEIFDLIHAHDWLCFEAGLALKQQYR